MKKYGFLIKNLRKERGLMLRTVADAVRTSRSVLSLVEHGHNPPYCLSYHERLMDALQPTADQRREIERAWRAEEVQEMTPRQLRGRPAALPAKLAPLVDELVTKVERASAQQAQGVRAYSASERQHAYSGTVAEVRAQLLQVLRREDPRRRAFVTIVLGNGGKVA